VALSKKMLYLVLALLVVALVAAGCAGSKTPAPAAKPAAATAVKIVAYYPLNKDHKYIADYLVALGKKHPDQIKVEVVDMQSPDGRTKWRTSGLSCAGVFVNGKTRWEVLRDGKKENVDFLKRMGSFWDQADFEAVVKQVMEDPSKTPVVPSAKGKPKKKPAAEGSEAGNGAAPAAAPAKPAKGK
jgi:ABC-type glycerol-3-phosphate transport system substrate-binding protein